MTDREVKVKVYVKQIHQITVPLPEEVLDGPSEEVGYINNLVHGTHYTSDSWFMEEVLDWRY